MSDQSAPTPTDEREGIQLDPNIYIQALEERVASLTRENTFLAAALTQTNRELASARQTIDSLAETTTPPAHNGRVTPKKGKAKRAQEA